MTLQDVTQRVRNTVGAESGLDATVKFNFGENGFLFIDGRAKPNQVTNEDSEADVTITVTLENFLRIIDHQLSPQMALMTGKMRLKGAMHLAMRLNKVFGTK